MNICEKKVYNMKGKSISCTNKLLYSLKSIYDNFDNISEEYFFEKCQESVLLYDGDCFVFD